MVKKFDLTYSNNLSLLQSMRKSDIKLKIQQEWNDELELYSKDVSYIEKMNSKFDLNNKLIIPFNRYDYV